MKLPQSIIFLDLCDNGAENTLRPNKFDVKVFIASTSMAENIVQIDNSVGSSENQV
ncbi:hypothetical protein RhiirC2_761935 [Rhizophagus irregularis]|uniref:Uncharacterized protein n=1 Tax=Rhizophagus irregularis TaxID=588596 RepID=A0A2N1MF83_9GLOM|nr:hypothetical protein RhiirC2_761935 [Rhizophagus irregularis]